VEVIIVPHELLVDNLWDNIFFEGARLHLRKFHLLSRADPLQVETILLRLIAVSLADDSKLNVLKLRMQHLRKVREFILHEIVKEIFLVQ
jgi:hypothetical protein